MENHYETLGLSPSASHEEIRRAYRILARRYHPDLNPGVKVAEERFKRIASAYEVLGDGEKKKNYDIELERSTHGRASFDFAGFQESQKRQANARKRYMEGQARAEKLRKKPATPFSAKSPKDDSSYQSLYDKVKKFLTQKVFDKDGPIRRNRGSRAGTKVSVIEVSVSIKDAIYGVKKTVELAEPERTRKISVSIPAGVRNGSVVHLRSKSPHQEEVVMIIRIPSHPFLSIQTRGLVSEIPITIQEAICGASISVPTLEEPVSVRVNPGTNSGQEIRIAGRGAFQKDGTRGDLIVRFLIQVPQSPDAVGLKDKAKEIETYYEASVRDKLPRTLV